VSVSNVVPHSVSAQIKMDLYDLVLGKPLCCCLLALVCWFFRIFRVFVVECYLLPFSFDKSQQPNQRGRLTSKAMTKGRFPVVQT
jgi:hypothetical protein